MGVPLRKMVFDVIMTVLALSGTAWMAYLVVLSVIFADMWENWSPLSSHRSYILIVLVLLLAACTLYGVVKIVSRIW